MTTLAMEVTVMKKGLNMRNGSLWAWGLVAGLAALPVSAMNGSRAAPGDGNQVVSLTSPGDARTDSVAAPRVSTLNEGFDNIALLAGSGWHWTNLSSPVGALSWFQGTATTATPTPGPFNAHLGAANAYIAANFNSTGSTGTISNWLMTPELDFGRDSTFTFWTRKPTIGAGQTDYPDRLEIRLSTAGGSTNAGATATTTGDFTTLLLSVNPTLITGVYPQVWTQYTITNAEGLPRNGTGRIAFRYFVTGAGSLGTNSDYIGIDTVSYSAGSPQYQVGVTVSGLVGNGVGLSLNGGPATVRMADGGFVFPDYVDQGGSYSVTVTSQPSHPKQTCEASPASGTIGGGNAAVTVTCTTDPFVLSVLSGDGQEVPIHVSFPDALVVELVDAAGDPVEGAEITFESPISGASALLHDLHADPANTLVITTSALGVATVHAFANGEGGCYGVTASHENANAVGWQLRNLWYASIFSDGFETSPAKRRGIPVCTPD